MKYLSTTAISLLAFSFAQAETFMGSTELSDKTIDSIVVLGTAKLTNIKTESVTVTGTLSFNHVEANGNVTVVGPIEEGSTDLICKDLDILGVVKAKKVKCVNVNIVGSADLEELESTGEIKIIGGTEIKKGNLKDLFVTASDIKLKDVKVNNITIDKIPLSSQTQTVMLEGDSAVSGTITFKSEKGVVTAKDKAQAGKIVGGTLQGEQGQNNKPNSVNSKS